MPDEIIRDDITVGGTPTRPGVRGIPATTATLLAPASVETVAGGRLPWLLNIPKALPFQFDDLTNDFGDDIYAKMLLDPQVSACIETLKTAILADGITITPAVIGADNSGSKKAQKIADFISSDLDRLYPSFDSALWALLDGMAYGSKVAEQVYEMRDAQLHLSALKVKPRRATAYVVDAYMNVLGLLAVIPGVATSTTITAMIPIQNIDEMPNFLPRDKFCIFSYWPRDSDPRGTSILRSAYRPWWDKQQMVPEYLKYLTQFASASIIATAPESAVPYGSDPLQPAQTAAQMIAAALDGFRNGTYVVLPFGSTAKPIELSGEGIPFIHAFERFDRQITTAVLHQTLATQESEHQTRAAAQVHQDVLALLIRMGKRAVATMLQHDVFEPLVRYNFGDAAAINLTPRASLSAVEPEDLTPRMTAIANLAKSGLILPSQLADLFADLNLPAASAADLNAYAEDFAAPAVPPLPPRQPEMQPMRTPSSNLPVSGQDDASRTRAATRPPGAPSVSRSGAPPSRSTAPPGRPDGSAP
jgi:hypothetical protein